MSEYVDVKNLDAPIRAALESLGYGRKDIDVRTVEKLELGDSGVGDGYRAYTCLVNMATGEHTTTWGSWGGANMFDRRNAVDNDTREYTLPPNGVVLKGHKGGGRPVAATLYIPAAMRARVLPAAPSEDLPVTHKDALYCFRSYKSGPYRVQELRRRKVTQEVLDDLVTRGLLSRNRAGSMALTTAGKNAASGYRPATPSYAL